MIDIHSHILWGLDDGAPDRDISISMLKLAAESGTTDIVATPHANSEYTFAPPVIAERISDLQSVCPTPRIHRGCDFHLNYENIADALENPRKYTVNGKNFLLVEFADLQIPPTTATIFERFLRQDMTPIITHPERNPILSHKLDQLATWVQQGSLIQITAKSLEGLFGAAARDSAWKMMARGIVHFVASDGHDPEYRPPRLDLASELVTRKYGEDVTDMLFRSNPSVVIDGRDPWLVQAVEPVRKRSFFDFLKP